MTAVVGDSTLLDEADASMGRQETVQQAEVGSATAASSDADPAATVFKEVSGSTKSLVAHMTEFEEGEDGYIPIPELMDFNSWQRWRTQFGKRPIKARDGYHTYPRQESQLWRSTMLAVHGPEWEADLHRVTRQRSKSGNAAREPEHFFYGYSCRLWYSRRCVHTARYSYSFGTTVERLMEFG